jgi:hypothetical protein
MRMPGINGICGDWRGLPNAGIGIYELSLLALLCSTELMIELSRVNTPSRPETHPNIFLSESCH